MIEKLTDSNISSLIEAIPDAVYFKDSELRNIVINKAFENLLHLSRESIVGKKDEDIMPKDLADQCRISDEQVLREKKPIRVEEEMSDRNGNVFFFDTIKFPLFDENNDVVGLGGISRDITSFKRQEQELKKAHDEMEDHVARRTAELKQTNEDLKASEERFRVLFEYAPDPLYLYDKKGRFIDGNKAAEKMIGYKKEELIGKSFLKLDLLSKPQIAKAASRLALNVMGKATGPDEYTLKRKNGETVVMEANAIPIRLGGKLVSLGIARDMTEHKRMEEELKKSRDELELKVEERTAELKRSERALAERERKYREVFETSPAAIAVLDHEGSLIDVNDRLHDWLGYERSSVIGQKLTDLPFLTEGSKRIADDALRRRFAGEKIDPYEMEFVRRNGSIMIGWINATLLKDETGKAIGDLAMITDVTAHKEAEEEIIQLKKQLEFILGATKTGVDIIDADYNLQYVDPEWAKAYGDYRGRKCYEYFMGREQPCPGCGITEAKKTKKPVVSEETLVKEGGRSIQVITQPFQDADGNWLFAEVNVDITERKKAENKLKEANDIINRSSSVAFTWRNQEGWPVEFVSDNVENLFGYTAEEFKEGKIDYASCIHNEDLERVAGEVAKFSGEEGRTDFVHNPYRIITKTGSEKVIRDWTFIVRNDDKRITHYKGIVEDITERVTAEDELKKYRKHLEDLVEERSKELYDTQEKLVRREKLAVLGQLAGSIAHELRNPLGTINNALYLIKSIPPGEHERAHKYVDIASKGVADAEQIISGLLGLSRMKTGSMIAIGAARLVAQVLSDMTIPAEIEVAMEIPQDLSLTSVDPQQISHVLTNLIVNACQAMPDGGRLAISGEERGDEVCIAMKDEGCGISEEDKKKLFEPLFTTKAKGIGLGLVVSKNLVEINGGRIEVESEEGRGSTFTVILPAHTSN